MRYSDLIEGVNSKCIVIDVQPAYESGIYFDVSEMFKFLSKQGELLMFVNADETGITDDNVEHDIIPWWEEHSENNSVDFWPIYNRMTINDKGYGYFRAWMDNGISDSLIIKTIRELYSQNVTDTRQLFGGEDSEEYYTHMQEFLGNEFEEWMLDDPLLVEWTSVSQLKQFNGAYLMGGGREECLKEVTLLMNAFNIKYKLVDKFIYG